MKRRFELPAAGAATAVRFPPVEREELGNGLRVRAIRWPAVPVVSLVLVIPGGVTHDPPAQPGLVGLMADMLDEGAGTRDTIALADALERIGSQLDIDVGADATTIALTTLARHLDTALSLVADVVMRPHLDQPGLDRARELRLSRLQQLRRTPTAPADRALLGAIFGAHPYGHGVMGTTPSLQGITLDEVRARWRASIVPTGATLVVAGAIEPATIARRVASALREWTSPTTLAASSLEVSPVELRPRTVVHFIDRPGASQSEVRVGQLGPPRRTPSYHPLVTLNAVLGSQFTSRINRNLRETRGITSGARTAFDFRREAGVFECQASVQADSTGIAVGEILLELDAVRQADAIGAEELEQARASLTRGYVRGFETARQLARADGHLAVHDLPDDTYDRFVPWVEQVSPQDLTEAAKRHVAPDACAVVVVGDARHAAALEPFGRVEIMEPEF